MGYLAGLNAGFVASFTIGTGGAFQTSTTSIVAGTASGQTLTLSGSLGGTTLTGTIAELGLTFSLNVDPTGGSSAAIAGFYSTPSLESSSGMTYSLVGSQGDVFVLVVSPTLISSGFGTVTNNSFTVQGTSSATISGTVNPTTTVLSGTVITSTAGTTTFSGLPSTTTPTDRLINLSARGVVTPARSLVGGFVVAGTAPKTLVIRGVGPALANFGIPGYLTHPQLTLMTSAGAVLATNAGWGGSPALAAAFLHVGAFTFASGSADCAIEITLSPGAYTLQVTDAVNDAGGVALAEVYDASIDPDGVTQKLVNLSCLGTVGAGVSALDCGFVVSGNSPKQVLLRGVGPSLAAFGVPGLVSNPVINVYDVSNNLVATNDDWSTPVSADSSEAAATAIQLSAAATATGAFPLLAGSQDAALIVALAPGNYTAVVSTTGSAGTGLVEVYELAQ